MILILIVIIVQNEYFKKHKVEIKYLAWISHSVMLGLLIKSVFKHDKLSLLKVLISHLGLIIGLSSIAIVIPCNKHVTMRKITFASLMTFVLFSLSKYL